MDSPPWQAAGWLMLHLLWVGAAIALAAAAARWLLRRAPPGARYGVALACFGLLAASPAVLAIALPMPQPAAARAGVVGEWLPLPAAAIAARADPLPRVAAGPASTRPLQTEESPRRNAAGQQAATAPAAQTPWLVAAARWLPWLWLAGSPLTFLYLAGGLVGGRRLRRRTARLEDGPPAVLCARLAAALGLARRVALGVCDRVASPVVLGIVKPIILLPPAVLSECTPQQLEMILLHELAHVRRWDTLVNLLQRLVESLLFFHPAVWWLSAWLRLERELCCDRLVVARTGRPLSYAETLAALSGPDGALPANAAAMSQRRLAIRIRHILQIEDRSMKVTPRLLGLAVVLVLAGSLLVGLYAQDGASQAPRPSRPPNPAKVVAQQPPERDDAPGQGDTTPAAEDGGPGGETPGGPVDAEDNLLTFRGKLEPGERVALGSRIDARVAKITVRIGDRVKRGDALAELDAPELELEVRKQQGQIRQVEAEVVRALRAVETAQVAADVAVKTAIAVRQQAVAEVQAAKAVLEHAKGNYQRAAKLAEKNAVSQTEVSAAAAALQQAETDVVVAEAKLAGAEAGQGEQASKLAEAKANLDVEKARLDVARTDLERARLRLEYTQVRAPFDGIIERRSVDTGAFVRPGDAMFLIAQTDPLRVTVFAPAAEARQVRRGMPAQIHIPGRDAPLLAKVSRLVQTLSPRNQESVLMEIDIPNPKEEIRGGAIVEVNIVLKR